MGSRHQMYYTKKATVSAAADDFSGYDLQELTTLHKRIKELTHDLAEMTGITGDDREVSQAINRAFRSVQQGMEGTDAAIKAAKKLGR